MSDFLYTNEKNYVIKELFIVNTNGSGINIRALLLELDIFEDIYNSTISGYALLNDSNDLIATLPLSGFEFLRVVIEKPGSERKVLFEKSFRIYKMTPGTVKQATTSNQTYLLNFCSEENVVSASRRISKSYRGKTMSSIVTDILTKQLKVTPEKLRATNIENTSGVHDVIIPFLNPLTAISWLASRTVSSSAKSRGATFMFYENTQGYNFKSLETLFQGNTKAKYSFGPKNAPPEKTDTSVSEIRDVVKYEFMKMFDVLSGITSGMFSSTIKTIDLVKLEATDYAMRYDELFNITSHIEKQGSAFSFQNEYEDRFKKKVYENSYSLMRMYPTNRSHDTDSVISSKQPSIKQNLVEKWLLQRITQINQLDYFKLKLVIPGDTYITVGDIIEFQIPLVGAKNPGASNENPFYSGRYLLTAIRHKINLDNYEMIVEATRDCLSKPYPQAENSLALINEIKKS
jgi:hypothetical protein